MDSHGLGIYYDPAILVEHLVPKERLTRRFMLRRHFWQGVSDVILWYEQTASKPRRLWLLLSGLEGLSWVFVCLIGYLLWSFLRRPMAVARDLSKIETARNYFFQSFDSFCSSFGQAYAYLGIGMGRLAKGTRKRIAPEQRASDFSYPPPKNWNQIAWWSYPYLMLKRNFFGIGGIFLLVIVGLYVSGALVEPLRWYLVGIASALLLLGGGVLVLSYIRLILNRLAMDQSVQISNINKQISDIKSVIKKEVSRLNKELSVIKDDVFVIGYDMLKEQNKLAAKVSQLETKASNIRRAKRPPKDITE